MRSVFISHSSSDKPFVLRLASELLAEGVPVWLDSWEMGPGDSLLASLESALDGSAQVLVVNSQQACATEWVRYEVDQTLEAEKRVCKQLLVPLRIDDSHGLDSLHGRVHIDLRGTEFLNGVHRLVGHLRSQGLSSNRAGHPVLPLVFENRIELDTFILKRIIARWLGGAPPRAGLTANMMRLVKSERYVELQDRLQARASTYGSRSSASSEGSHVMRTLDAAVVRKERDLCDRSALVLCEFAYGFGLSNDHVLTVLRWYARAAMHDLMITLEAADESEPRTVMEFGEFVLSQPMYHPREAEWWDIDDPVRVRVHHLDRQDQYQTTGRIIVPRTALRAQDAKIARYPGVAFKGAFEFDALCRYVLPQLVYLVGLDEELLPGAWNEDSFRLWENSD